MGPLLRFTITLAIAAAATTVSALAADPADAVETPMTRAVSR